MKNERKSGTDHVVVKAARELLAATEGAYGSNSRSHTRGGDVPKALSAFVAIESEHRPPAKRSE